MHQETERSIPRKSFRSLRFRWTTPQLYRPSETCSPSGWSCCSPVVVTLVREKNGKWNTEQKVRGQSHSRLMKETSRWLLSPSQHNSHVSYLEPSLFFLSRHVLSCPAARNVTKARNSASPVTSLHVNCANELVNCMHERKRTKKWPKLERGREKRGEWREEERGGEKGELRECKGMEKNVKGKENKEKKDPK